MTTSITNTNLEAIEKVKEVMGFGVIYKRPSKSENRKRIYEYMLGSFQAEVFLKTILPFTLVKRRQVELALEFRSLGQKKPYQKIANAVYQRMCAISAQVRELNGRSYNKEKAKIVPLDYVEV